MNFHVKLRLGLLAAGIASMGIVIVLMVIQAQQQGEQLHARLDQVESESFRIAERFRDWLRQLNSSLYRYGSDHDPADLRQFTKASYELDVWIDDQKPKVRTQHEKVLMQQIDTAYNRYLEAAHNLEDKLERLGKQSASISDYRPFIKEAQNLFDLGQALAKAHSESRALVLAQASESLTELRALLLASLGGLFVFGVVLAWAAYRDMIAPLRVKLVESQALMERQEKLASLGMLAAGVAHEIRNPLTAIKAALFIQQKKFQQGSAEHLDSKLVEREILRLERIVSDFLLFARPAEPKREALTADLPLKEVRDLMAPQLAKSHIRVVVEDAPPLPISVDVAQLKQVLINLVQNAAEAAGSNGLISLSARKDRRRMANTEREVVILEVTDNGPGISLEVQKRLFDPFFTTKDSGTGLGLSIAASLVQKHGGALEYQTQLDHGTTFGIILPQ